MIRGGWYAREGTRGLGKYHVFHQHTLDPSEYTLSDTEHFKREMQTKYPGVVEHVQPSRTGRFTSKPLPEMTWHHRDSSDSLKLVDRKDHNKYHKIYHPNSSGGRKKWGGGKICRK